jgi:hypothetical protein
MLYFLEDHRVLICKQHQTAVVNLDTHLLHHHHVPAPPRRQVVDCFSRLKLLDPAEVRLPDEPAKAIAELGKPLTGLQCKACGYITINTNALRKHCKKDHHQAWTGDKSLLYNTISVQTFFRSGGLQKYFRVR